MAEADATSLLDLLVKVGESVEGAFADVQKASSCRPADMGGTVDEVLPAEGTRTASSAATDGESKAAPKVAPWVAAPLPPPPAGVAHPKLPSSLAEHPAWLHIDEVMGL